MTVIKKHLKYFKKKELNAEAGLLTLVAAGGLWPKERKFGTQPPMVDNPLCPHCTGEVQDDFHLFWGCPTLGLSKEKEIIKTQKLQHKITGIHSHASGPGGWSPRPGRKGHQYQQKRSMTSMALTQSKGLNPMGKPTLMGQEVSAAVTPG